MLYPHIQYEGAQSKLLHHATEERLGFVDGSKSFSCRQRHKNYPIMTSLFKGLAQAQNYAACRPTYPTAVFDLIASKMGVVTPSSTTDSSLCVDIGCGNGQATTALAGLFDHVIGIDPSDTQIKNAMPHPKVEYRQGTMEEALSKMDDESVSCITSAQAAHWLDIPAFYDQAHRVLKPGGVVAIWCYGLNHFPNHPSVEKKVHDLYENVLGEYWDNRRRLVENHYRDIPLIDTQFPEAFTKGEHIDDNDTLHIQQEISGQQLVGYLRSWSAYANYCKVHNVEPGSSKDPVKAIEEETTTNETKMLSIWPVSILISTKKLEDSTA